MNSDKINETVKSNDRVFEAPVISATFEFFTSIVLEQVFSLNTLIQHVFRSISRI